MTELLDHLTPENEATYDSLISLIENNQDRLALILVACDDLRLRQKVIDRYELEAAETKIRSFRIVLGKEPSLRAGLANLNMRSGASVVTVTGAEWLLRVKMREEEEQSDLDKFFGYLQWTREGLREFQCPIVLWVTLRILKEISLKSPDFWSWRKAVLKFASQEAEPILVQGNEGRELRSRVQSDEELVPPLEELLSEIRQLESIEPESTNLATLYSRLGQIYVKRIKNGKAKKLEYDRQEAIFAFQNAINRYEKLNNQSSVIDILTKLGNFFDSQSHYEEAIKCHERALKIAREIEARKHEATSLNNLGLAYGALGQHQQAINLHYQSLEIRREISDRYGEGVALGNLGLAYDLLGKYQRAIDFHQQSLEIKREIGDRYGEGVSLGNLGLTYKLLGKYQRAIDFYQQSLEIKREVGDRYGEGVSLGNLGVIYNLIGQHQRAIALHQQNYEIACEIGNLHSAADALFNKVQALAKYESRRFEALTALQQARSIYEKLRLDYDVEKCDKELYTFNQIIATEQRQVAPAIPSKSRAVSKPRVGFVFWVCIGIMIALLLFWLLK